MALIGYVVKKMDGWNKSFFQLKKSVTLFISTLTESRRVKQCFHCQLLINLVLEFGKCNISTTIYKTVLIKYTNVNLKSLKKERGSPNYLPGVTWLIKDRLCSSISQRNLFSTMLDVISEYSTC